MQTVGQYQIEITQEQSYQKGSTVKGHQYDLEHFDEIEYLFPTMFGIKVFKNNLFLKSAIIGSVGGGTGLNPHAVIVEDARFLICCSDTIFCLSVPDLTLIWRTQADQASCFEIYVYEDSYIVHGEFEISRLEKNGKIIWQQSGADIFTTPTGLQDFSMTDKFIIAKDFENRTYKFDYDGRDFTDMKQFS